MLVMLSVQKHFRLLVLSTSFLSHIFSRTGSLQNNLENNLFHIAAVSPVYWSCCQPFLCSSDTTIDFVSAIFSVWFACRAAGTALHFAAWMSSWWRCAQQNGPWNFWTNISHMVTFNLQKTWVRSSIWPLFSMFLFFYCSYCKITTVLAVLFAWHVVLFCKVLASWRENFSFVICFSKCDKSFPGKFLFRLSLAFLMLCFHKTGEFGLHFLFSYAALIWKLCQKEAMEIWICYCRSAELNHFQCLVQLLAKSLIQLYSALLTVMQTHTDSFGKVTAQYNQSSYLMHSVTVKNKKLWCMVTTRVNGSLSWALQTSPKEMWLIAQGLFLNHPFYTEVGNSSVIKEKL